MFLEYCDPVFWYNRYCINRDKNTMGLSTSLEKKLSNFDQSTQREVLAKARQSKDLKTQRKALRKLLNNTNSQAKTRRTSLFRGGLVALALTTGILTSAHSYMSPPAPVKTKHVTTIETPSSKFFNNFPLKIPHAKSVKKYGPTNPSLDFKVLVHIRQKHHLSSQFKIDTDDETLDFNHICREIYPEVNNVQKEIYGILDYFITDHGLKSVYCEGVFKPVHSIEAKLHYMSGLQEVMEHVARDKAELEKAKNNEFDLEEAAKWLYVPGGALYQGSKGRLTILPAELKEYHDRAFASLDDESIDSKDLSKIIFDYREHVMIAQTCDSRNPFSVFVYGGEHSLVDDVKGLLKIFSQSRIRLIEITPNSYSEE